MSRDQSVDGRSLRSPLVAAGWFFAVAVPVVGLVLGVMALRKPSPLRDQAAAIVAVSLLGLIMWVVILTGVPGSRGLFTS